jgi:hypothetical protein
MQENLKIFFEIILHELFTCKQLNVETQLIHKQSLKLE